MASIDDIGSDTEQFFLELALAERKPTPVIKATGLCLWCGEPVEDGRRWCEAGCQQDWMKAKR